MRTIFISSFHVLVSRNILASPLLSIFSGEGWRIVLLVPEKKRDFFQKEFGDEHVIVEGVTTGLARQEVFARYLALSAVRTKTLALKRKTELSGRGRWLSLCAGRAFQAMIRRLNPLLTPRGRFGPLLDQYRPEIVFATDVQNENDIRLMQEARDRGIKTAGMVRSWDNLTAKGSLRIVPNLLIVNNEIVKEEAIRLHGVPESRIRIVGIPHYDRYGRPAHSREEFSRALGLNPSRKFVLYAPTGDRYLSENKTDQWMIQCLSKILPPEYDLLIRMPPTDSVLLDSGSLPDRAVIHRPGHAASETLRKLNELTLADDEILRDTLAYAELVVAGPSTIIIDAAVFDKPIVAISFDGDREFPYERSIRRYYDYDHMQPIAASGGVRLAKNAGDLKTWVRNYLDEPQNDAEGRKRIRNEQCWKLDGNSSQRLYEALANAARAKFT